MKDFGKEIIEISGVEYTLILNRKGIVAWEKFAKDDIKKAQDFSKSIMSITADEESEIKDDTNPFEGLDEIDKIDEDRESLTKSFQKLYWIMLYETHKFSLTEAEEIYNLAIKEYGEEQIMALANQMLEDANKDKYAKDNNEIKNLKALRPTK